MPSRSVVVRILSGLAALAAIALATFAAWWTTLPIRDAALESARRETQLEALSLSEQFTAVTRSAISSLNAITLKLQAEGGPRGQPASELDAELRRVAGDAVGTRAMLVLDATGTVVATVGVPATQEGLSVRQRPAIAYHLAHPTDLGIHVAHAHYSDLTGGWVLPISRIIASRDGKMLGAVLVGIDLSYMHSLYEQMGNLRDANFLIVGRGSGGIIFRQPFIDGSIGFLPVGDPPIFQGAGTYEVKSQLDGITRIVSYRQLRDVDAVMLVGYPRDQVLAPWRTFARERMIWTASSLSLFSLICYAAWFGYRRYGRQLRALEQGFKTRESELRREADNIENFSVSLSQRLSTPFSKLRGILEADAENLPEMREDERQDVLASAIKMEGLAQDVQALALARNTAVKRQDLDVTVMAYAIARSLRGGDPTRTVEFRIQDGMYATADATLLRVVLANLMGNAWKFTAQSTGTIIEVGARAGLVETVFYVRDNGPGFDPANEQWIFKPFHRLNTSDDFEGQGIGLTAAQRIIERHGGRIWAKGRIGMGAAFFFTIQPPLKIDPDTFTHAVR